MLCTHAHDDHVRRAPDAGQRFGAPTALHRADLGLWTLVHPDLSPNQLLDDGQVVTVGSIAAFDCYPGGAGYNAAKHAVRAMMRVLRLELVGEPVRVTEIDPGMVETEFSLVRFDGDAERADAVVLYRVPATVQVVELVTRIRERGDVPVLFDVDDLIVDPGLASELDPVLSAVPGLDLALYWQGVRRYRTTLEASDGYIGSTPYLCRRVGELTGLQVVEVDITVPALVSRHPRPPRVR